MRVNLTDSLDRSKEEYLDKYEGIKSEILNITRFDENSDLSTTYLGKINTTPRQRFGNRREISDNRARVHSRQTVRQYRMSDFIRYKS